MDAPVFKGLNLGGAPVVDIVALTAKPNAPYAELFKRIWYDYNFNSPARQAYTTEVLRQNGPVQNPLPNPCSTSPSGSSRIRTTAASHSSRWRAWA